MLSNKPLNPNDVKQNGDAIGLCIGLVGTLLHTQGPEDSVIFQGKGKMTTVIRLPWWLSSKESACQCRRCGFDSWVGKIPWRRKWQLTLVFLPGKFNGQREPGRQQSMGLQKESDTT